MKLVFLQKIKHGRENLQFNYSVNGVMMAGWCVIHRHQSAMFPH